MRLGRPHKWKIDDLTSLIWWEWLRNAQKRKINVQSVQNYYFSLSNLWLFCRRLSVWLLCLRGTPVSSGAKNALKSMEIKTNARASFTITLLVHWIRLLSFTAQNSKDGKGWNLELGQRFQVSTRYIPKIPNVLRWIAFPVKIQFGLSFWDMKML